MLFFAAAALAFSPVVITVDDDGAADFSELAAAIAAAAPGDTLLIWPGSYQATSLTKNLKLIAADPAGRPRIGSEFVVDGAPEITFVGLEFDDLWVLNVPGRARIDDCWMLGTNDSGAWGTFVIANCPDVLITRSLVEYRDHFQMYSGHAALRIEDSRVQLVDSTVLGVDGEDDPIGPDGSYAAIRTFGTVYLFVVGCNVLEGATGCGLSGCAAGEAAIYTWSGSLHLVIRGSRFHTVDSVSGTFRYTWSGVTLTHVDWFAPVTVPAEPYLMIGQPSPDSRRVSVFGPTGSPCVVFFSMGAALLDVPAFAGDMLALDLSQLFYSVPLTLIGQDVAATSLLSTPSGVALVGLPVDVQALVAMPKGAFVTNSSQLVLRY